jgi:shikimate dehydrogenase
VVRASGLVGYNTDGMGFRTALQGLGWNPKQHRHVLVLGAGGSARAVVWQLARRGQRLRVANRTLSRARGLVRWLKRLRPYVQLEACALDKIPLEAVDLVVNTTTNGMDLHSEHLLVPKSLLQPGVLVYDLIYHRKTRLIALAQQRGCVADNGLSMLLYQGAAAFRLWFRQAAPTAAMQQALEQAVRKPVIGRMP